MTDDRATNQSRFFWSSSYNSLYEAVMLRLIRLYDPHPTGFSLVRLLTDIRKSRRQFTRAAFRDRLKEMHMQRGFRVATDGRAWRP
jgi:hypothetical protein